MTCADAISRFAVSGLSAPVAGPTTSGGVMSAPRRWPAMLAPIARSGSATRAIGRPDSESSPTSVVAKRCPASKPHSNRIVVPELPQSTGPSGARMRSRPVPWMTNAAPSRLPAPPAEAIAERAACSRAMVAPSWTIAFAERPLSAPSPRPSTRIGVSDSSENSSARWPIDLSPGITTVPASGRRAGWMTSFMARRASHERARRHARGDADPS